MESQKIKEMEELLAKQQAEIEQLKKCVRHQSYYADITAIQMLQAQYINYLGSGKGWGRIYDDLISHKDPDVSLTIMDAGTYIGQEHVKRAAYSMAGRVDQDGNPVDPSKRASKMASGSTNRVAPLLMLTISTPNIVVSEDGNHAWGNWHIFGPHSNNVFDPATGTKRATAFWIAGKYANEFVKEDGVWKFKVINAVCWLRTPYDKSWLECPNCRVTPAPYDPPDLPGQHLFYNPDAPRFALDAAPPMAEAINYYDLVFGDHSE